MHHIFAEHAYLMSRLYINGRVLVSLYQLALNTTPWNTDESSAAMTDQTVQIRVYWDTILGSGGEGTVYAGRIHPDDIPVAVKRYQKCVMCSEKCCKGLVPKEVCMLNRCNDISGIIDVHTYWFHENNAYIAMEYMPGSQDLFDVIENHGCLDEETSKYIFRQVVDAVIGMRQKGVVHGDIKVENILMQMTTGKIKLIDFGMAHRTVSSPMTKCVGTILCYPPEFFLRDRCYWEPRTVWSLGCLLYTMTHADSAFHCVNDISSDKFVVCEETSDGLRDILFGMLDRSETHRLTIDKVSDHVWLK